MFVCNHSDIPETINYITKTINMQNTIIIIIIIIINKPLGDLSDTTR